jgi:hypothetical protein
MTEQPAFMRKATDITVYKLDTNTIPDLVEETGLTETQWLNVLAQDQNFGLQSKVYVVPSEVRWRALLEKVVDYFADIDEGEIPPGFTAEDVRLIEEIRTKE